jgi:hypothetical protein
MHTYLQHKPKPAARDCDDPNARQVLTMAKIHLFAYVIREAPYHNRKTYEAFACLVYEATWQEELPNVPYEEPEHWLIGVVSSFSH